MTKFGLADSALKVPSNYSIFKRVANLTLLVVAAAICVNIWLLNTEQSQNWHNNQSSQLGRSLAKFTADIIAPHLNEKQNEQILRYINLLSRDNHVAGVSVYNRLGEVVESNEQNASVLASFLIEDEFPLVFVEEVVSEGKLLGYVRLLLDKEQVMLYHHEYQNQIYKQLLMLMLVAGLVGLLITRAYYKIRFRHYEKVSKTARN
ncbi:AhpA/YtjB family protein [Aliiglaciecola sp. 3_MG-2023]|uniref:AhpA/YtjB family protein n=1 Tax=Aliiglaciecola sp. 3_MG-2023 TaxID=3062644 RepID=UPI0026E3B6E5|nr:AhpA/YtjB family protein [Aliiglaciecola sp. 3_MG-2023]MDO6691829.1 AhpA/YtjB family protein [Aliiglaciecola sp. 3_MG-2023]